MSESITDREIGENLRWDIVGNWEVATACDPFLWTKRSSMTSFKRSKAFASTAATRSDMESRKESRMGHVIEGRSNITGGYVGEILLTWLRESFEL